ncbi:MAG: YdcF family protein [Vicinamibacteria bacterium]|nr:YdcF family protein [Vicinamibacteria bacterium]
MTRREQAALGAALGLAAGAFTRDLDLTSLVSFWGDRLVFLPLGAIFGALCAATRLRRAFYACVALLAVLWVGVAYGPLSRMLLAGLVRSDALRPADAVLVLGTRMQSDGDPTATQLSRLLRGLELVKDGLAPRLMITELPPPYAAQRPFVEALLARFKPDVELVDFGPTFNTRDEAVMAAEYLKKRGLRRIIVTSSPTHTYRAAALLEAQGLEVMATPARETRFDLETLDRPEERLLAFGAIIHERLGIVVYRRRGWIR